jgi:hypothetical protein
MPVSGSVLLLYAGAHKISLKYLFPEKNVHLINSLQKNTKNTDRHPAVLLNSFKFCAPVVFVWFWLFFSCLRRKGRRYKRGSDITIFFPNIAWNISFQKKMFIEVCCQKCQKCNTICVTTFSYWISRVCWKKRIKYIHQNLRYYETIEQIRWQSGCPTYQMTAFVFFIFKSAGEGEGWFEGETTWLINYKKIPTKHRQPPSCIVKFIQILCSSCIRLILVIP